MIGKDVLLNGGERIEKVVLLNGGELSVQITETIIANLSPSILAKDHVKVSKMGVSREFKAILEEPATTLAVFVVQTIENESPPEDAGGCIRFFKRKTHPTDLLAGDKFKFTILGLGDSNLLLDRQHTGAKDCNQVAQALDARLGALGGKRFLEQGEADERTMLTEVQPWIDRLCAAIKSSRDN
mmetsp:Transcript_37623/g.42983  ORF Transcript_37623/g.42983 Transcript_37623/m.42983 type:complete len:184 (-) Transcript_37623:221-772(-)|eukprot:CAMPEP_0194139054 /NCGR_PEP_ID=MMETSP0152-20130528/8800_1 /TAXON_ID=1049557 /ORGANISM="Thalassiothrix antarctica, Strain L6-D1" /LENGTH=183 /DNA_ID=CAMNT_0038836781 /DNA_START=138 /DNA_END=689 /DNA_ORIENTATION=-